MKPHMLAFRLVVLLFFAAAAFAQPASSDRDHSRHVIAWFHSQHHRNPAAEQREIGSHHATPGPVKPAGPSPSKRNFYQYYSARARSIPGAVSH